MIYNLFPTCSSHIQQSLVCTRMLHGDDNLVESKMKSTRCSKYSQQSAFSSFIILGTEKHFLSSCFHSLILSFVSTSHPYTHTSLMRNGKIMRERAISMWEGEGKLENFPWAFFSWTSSSVVWGKNSALLVRDPRTHKTGKNRKKGREKS